MLQRNGFLNVLLVNLFCVCGGLFFVLFYCVLFGLVRDRCAHRIIVMFEMYRVKERNGVNVRVREREEVGKAGEMIAAEIINH